MDAAILMWVFSPVWMTAVIVLGAGAYVKWGDR